MRGNLKNIEKLMNSLLEGFQLHSGVQEQHTMPNLNELKDCLCGLMRKDKGIMLQLNYKIVFKVTYSLLQVSSRPSLLRNNFFLAY